MTDTNTDRLVYAIMLIQIARRYNTDWNNLYLGRVCLKEAQTWLDEIQD